MLGKFFLKYAGRLKKGDESNSRSCVDKTVQEVFSMSKGQEEFTQWDEVRAGLEESGGQELKLKHITNIQVTLASIVMNHGYFLPLSISLYSSSSFFLPLSFSHYAAIDSIYCKHATFYFGTN